MSENVILCNIKDSYNRSLYDNAIGGVVGVADGSGDTVKTKLLSNGEITYMLNGVSKSINVSQINETQGCAIQGGGRRRRSRKASKKRRKTRRHRKSRRHH